MKDTIEDELIGKIKEKGIFSEYLPENFNVKADGWDIWGGGFL